VRGGKEQGLEMGRRKGEREGGRKKEVRGRRTVGDGKERGGGLALRCEILAPPLLNRS